MIMKKLVLFSSPIIVPLESMGKVEAYGLAISLDSWLNSDWQTKYIWYVLVTAELGKENVISKDGKHFLKDGIEFGEGDLIWDDYKEKVKESGMQYSVVDEAVELDENEYVDDLFTNKEKWFQLIETGGLTWQR